MNQPDHYRILGVSPEAPKQEIQAAYRRRLRETHPDRGGDQAEFHTVQTAWETLADPRLRREYDLLRFGRRAARRYGKAAQRPTHRKHRRGWNVRPPAPPPAPDTDGALVAVPWHARLPRGPVTTRPSLWIESAILVAVLTTWALAGWIFCATALASAAPLPIRALSLPLALAGALLVLGQAARARGRSEPAAPPVPFGRLILAAVFGAAALWTIGPSSPLGWWLAAFAMSGAASIWPIRRVRWAAGLRRSVGAALREFNAFGPAGTRPKADRATGRLLREVLTNLPASRLFVALPATTGTRIPHAIVCGNRIAVLCAPVGRDSGDTDADTLAAAVTALAADLPHAHLHGWVLWPTLPDHGHDTEHADLDHAPVADAAADIGRWLAQGGTHYDLAVLQDLRLRLATVPAQRDDTRAPAVRA